MWVFFYLNCIPNVNVDPSVLSAVVTSLCMSDIAMHIISPAHTVCRIGCYIIQNVCTQAANKHTVLCLHMKLHTNSEYFLFLLHCLAKHQSHSIYSLTFIFLIFDPRITDMVLYQAQIRSMWPVIPKFVQVRDQYGSITLIEFVVNLGSPMQKMIHIKMHYETSRNPISCTQRREERHTATAALINFRHKLHFQGNVRFF